MANSDPEADTPTAALDAPEREALLARIAALEAERDRLRDGAEASGRALSEAEERFRRMADSLPQIVWVTDPQGRTEFFSERWSAYTGAAYEPSTAHEVAARFVHPEDVAPTLAAWEGALREERTFEVEHRVRSASGEYRWFLARAEPCRDPGSGRVARWFGTSTDIHHARRTEAALHESQRRMQRALQIDTVGVLFFDMESNFLDANQAFLRMAGVGREALERGELRSDRITLPEWMPRTREAFEELRETGRLGPYEKELVRPDGSRWWGLFAGTRLGENEAMEFVIDITDRKRAEEDLLEAKRAAEAASQAKSDFLAVMSHELRTPLTGVIAYSELVETEMFGPVTAKQHEALSRIKANSWHLVSIIEEMLTHARAEAGKLEVRIEEADLAEIAREVAEIVESEAERRGLALRLEGAEAALPLWTDPGKVRQILLNLVGNAVKYTETGEVRVQVDGSSAEWVRVAVGDTGPGIEPADQERVFEAFTQVDSSHTRMSGGTGLGLAISRKLARLLDGDVTLQSKPGEGSTFTLHLPRRKAEAS